MSHAYEMGDVEFAYAGTPVLSIAELKIEAAEVTAFVGPNGSGKSTLLNILAFLDYPATGRLAFFGEPVTAGNYRRYRRSVGYVQQKPYLFHTTVYRNVELGLKIRDVDRMTRVQRVEAALAAMGLSALADRTAQRLSGGEAQKVALARVLALEPRALILDEPFSHLDRSVRTELEARFSAIAEQRSTTVIFTTHDYLQAQALAHRVYSLVDGMVLPLSVVNMYTGTLRGQVFDTGRIQVFVPSGFAGKVRLAIDSNQIVLSRKELDSSMRNRYRGRITGLAEENGRIHVGVEAGEKFTVDITRAALLELNVNIGDSIWLSFKSTAVHLF